MKWPKKPCPACGKVVSTLPAAWKNHARAHGIEIPRAVTTKTKQPKAEAPPPTPVVPAAVEADDAKSGPLHIKTVEDKERYLIAIAKQEEYRKSPATFVTENTTDEHMELRKLYAPNTIDQRGTSGEWLHKAARWAYFGDKREKFLDVQRGYVPVFDEHGRQVTNSGGDPMYTIDRVRHELQEARYHEKAAKDLERVESGVLEKSTVGSADDIDIPSAEGVRVTQSKTIKSG